jgi:hypothetical protein
MSSCDLVTEFWQFSPVEKTVKTCAGAKQMLAGDQSQDRQGLWPRRPLLVNHLIGAQKKRFRNLDADHVGGFKVDEQFELGWLLDR